MPKTDIELYFYGLAMNGVGREDIDSSGERIIDITVLEYDLIFLPQLAPSMAGKTIRLVFDGNAFKRCTWI